MFASIKYILKIRVVSLFRVQRNRQPKHELVERSLTSALYFMILPTIGRWVVGICTCNLLSSLSLVISWVCGGGIHKHIPPPPSPISHQVLYLFFSLWKFWELFQSSSIISVLCTEISVSINSFRTTCSSCGVTAAYVVRSARDLTGFAQGIVYMESFTVYVGGYAKF